MSTAPADRLRAAFDNESSSARLQTALAAGTHPDARFVETLIDRCAIEPDFFVRDMLTWALVRHPAAYTVPLLLQEVASDLPQARTQALHTLSKIGDPRGWEAITPELLRTPDDELARSAWRAAVILAPEAARATLAHELAALLGRGHPHTSAQPQPRARDPRRGGGTRAGLGARPHRPSGARARDRDGADDG